MTSFLLTSTFFVNLLFVSTAWGLRGGYGFRFGLGGLSVGEEGEVGDPCEPTRPRNCSEKTLVSGPVIEQLSEEEYGPNVCRYTFTFEANTYEYELRRSSKCERLFGDQCPLFCLCTNTCSEEVTTIEKEAIECCEGFTTQRPTPLEIVMCDRRTSRITSSGCPVSICTDEEETGGEVDGINK